MTELLSLICFPSNALLNIKQIALTVGKNCTSISREVRNHIIFKKTGGYGRCYNTCLHRMGCSHSSLCPSCSSSRQNMSLIPLILTDNGSVFSNPGAIESDRQGTPRTRIFYCDPSSPGQKGSAEKNHEFIRHVLPKETSFDTLEQADISLLMDHINSYSRESLGNKYPYEMFEFLYGSRTLQALGVHRIPANEVNLTPSLLLNK